MSSNKDEKMRYEYNKRREEAAEVVDDGAKMGEVLDGASRLANVKALAKVLGNLKIVIAMLQDQMAGRYHMSRQALLTLVGALIYLVSPIDAVPDVIPIVGFLDDATVLAWAFKTASEEIDRYKQMHGLN